MHAGFPDRLRAEGLKVYRNWLGEAQVIYFFYRPDCLIYLLLAYGKAQATDLSADEKKAVAAFASTIKATVD